MNNVSSIKMKQLKQLIRFLSTTLSVSKETLHPILSANVSVFIGVLQ